MNEFLERHKVVIPVTCIILLLCLMTYSFLGHDEEVPSLSDYLANPLHFAGKKAAFFGNIVERGPDSFTFFSQGYELVVPTKDAAKFESAKFGVESVLVEFQSDGSPKLIQFHAHNYNSGKYLLSFVGMFWLVWAVRKDFMISNWKLRRKKDA